jgi:hypothetical protein
MRNMIIFFILPFICAGCFTFATQDDMEKFQRDLAGDLRTVEETIIDAMPLPIPKDATKEIVGWISDLLILGGGAGVGGLGAKKLLNGKKTPPSGV